MYRNIFWDQMIRKRFPVLYIALCIFFASGSIYAQASLQRGVHISNANGNIISIGTGLNPQSYGLTLPPTSNPSLTTASLLYGIGSGNLNWTDTAGAQNGWVFTLQTSGSDLVPGWTDPANLGFWSLTGNSTASAYNGTTGSFLGTKSAEPLVLATTNTTTAQPIEFFTDNTERARIASTGEFGIGISPLAGRLLDVTGTAGTPNIRFTSLSAPTTGTSGYVTYSDVNGDLQSLGYPAVGGEVLTSTATGTLSWVATGTGSVTSVGLSLPVSVFTVTGSPVITSGTLTGTFTTQHANTVFAGPTSGADATPTFRALVPADLPSLNSLAWLITGNNGTTAYNGTTGNFLGTTDAEPLVIATTNTTTSEPIEFFTNNAEKMRLSAAGNLGINQSNPSQLLDVKDGNILLSNSGTAGQLQFQGTAVGVTTFQAGAQGATNINYTLPVTAPSANGQILSSTTGGIMSWVNQDSGVTSVGLSLPASVFNVSGSPVTSVGTLTGSFTTQNANTVFAGPVSGAAAVPTFRSLVLADLPSLNNTAWLLTGNSGTTPWNGTTGNFLGTTDVQPIVMATNNTERMRILSGGNVGINQSNPSQLLEVKNGNVLLSNSGTADQLQFQGTSTGTTTFQAGAQGATNINYTLPTAAPTANGQILSSTTGGAMSWTSASAGTVTSVGLALPVSVFNVTGSPVINTGTLTGSFTTQNANTVFAGPASGGAAVPTFRSLVPADLPSLNTLAWLITGNSGTTAYNGTTGNFLGTTDAQPLVLATTNTLSAQPMEFFTNNTERMRILSGGNVGINQTNPTQLLEVKSGNLLLSNAGTADQLQFQGTGGGITTFQAGAQGGTNINYTLPITAPSSNGQILSSTTGGAMSWITQNSGVTSVGLALPVSVFNVTGSPVTSVGTLTGSFTTQNANTVFAGPTSGLAAVPTFRSLVAADIPSLNYVSSVGLALPVSVFNVTGSPVTGSGTLTGSFTNQNANTVFAGPASGGAAVPTFRSLVPADLPSLNTLAWLITGNSGTTAYNGATGNFLGTTDAQPLVLATINTTSPQPMEFFTNNTEKMRILSGGNVGINQTNPSQLLEVKNGNLLLSNSGTADQLQFQGTGTGTTTFQAGAQGVTNINYTLPTAAPASNGQVLSSTTGGAMSWVNQNTGVTSVGLALPVSVFNVTGSPVTSSGTLTGSFTTQNANTVFAGPASGAAATPTFRSLVPADLPSLNTLAWLITGNTGTTAYNGTTGNFLGTTDAQPLVIATTNVTAQPIEFYTGNTEQMRLTSAGKLVIGNTTANTQLDVTKDFATREYNYATSLSGTNNDMNFDGSNNLFSLLRIATASAAFSITGLTGGQNGKIINIHNATAQTMTISNQNVLSTIAGDRIITGTGADIAVPSGGEANLQYSNTDSRWIVTSTQGVSVTGAWMNAGNSGLVDNTSNLLGTLDNVPVRFIAGATGTPNTRMVLDYQRGDFLIGPNSGTASFNTYGAGRLAMGTALNTTRLNSVTAGNSSRAINLIDSNAVLRLWNFNVLTGSKDPTIEFVGGTNSNQYNAANTWWDLYTTGTPYTTNTGTHSSGEHMAFRRRTGAVDSEYVSIFSNGNVGIGEDGTNSGGVANAGTRLTVANNDADTNAITNIIAMLHNSTKTPTTGYGTAIDFQGADSTTKNQDMGKIATVWSNASHTASLQHSDMTFSTDSSTSVLERVRISGQNGYVGINTTNPGVRMHINGGYATTSRTVTISNGGNNDVAVGDCAYLRLAGPTAPFTITGLAAGVDGQRLRLVDITGQDMTIANLSTLSAVGNRIETDIGADVVVKGSVPILDMTYDASLNEWLLGTLNANQIVGGIGSILYAVKAANSTITNSAVLANDADLVFSNVNANETWEVSGALDITEVTGINNNGGFNLAWSLPAGANMRVFYEAATNKNGNGPQGADIMTTSGVASTISIVGGQHTLALFEGIVVMGANTGNVQFKWCQNAANADGTTLNQYSYFRIMRVK